MKVESINFGEVEVATEKQITVALTNDSVATLSELKFKVAPEITIVSAPVTIAPNSKAELILSWIPDVNLNQPLNTNLEISGKEIYKG